MNKVTNKELDNKLKNLAQELRSKRYRIKICNNQVCIKNSKNVVGHLKCKRKDIPVCGFRNFCPDAHYRYFDYRIKYSKKEEK